MKTTTRGTLARTTRRDSRSRRSPTGYLPRPWRYRWSRGKGKSKRPPSSCRNGLRPCWINHRGPLIVSCLENGWPQPSSWAPAAGGVCWIPQPSG